MPVKPGHIDVHDDQVGPQLSRLHDDFPALECFATDCPLIVTLEQAAHAAAHDFVIVGDQNPPPHVGRSCLGVTVGVAVRRSDDGDLRILRRFRGLGFLERNAGADARAIAAEIDFELSTELAQSFAHAGNADAERGDAFHFHASRAGFDSLTVIDDFELYGIGRHRER